MSAIPTPEPRSSPEDAPQAHPQTSKRIVQGSASNEFVFAVVGHAGSGTSTVAKSLQKLLEDEGEVDGKGFEVALLKARTVIAAWATSHDLKVPEEHIPPRMVDVTEYQNLGDKMRSELSQDEQPDYAAVARALVEEIRRARGRLRKVDVNEGEPVEPDGRPRAYILDSLRHPEEVHLLRRIYRDAFVLIGVVCEENKRRRRLYDKYSDAGKEAANEFMKRDASAGEKHGQHVADAFHLSDFFVDNTADMKVDGQSNPSWDINDHLSRLVKIVTHSELLRPRVEETAMNHAFNAAMQSACLSRQVGAALVDSKGNVVSTGTNEVPKSGGGLYGEVFGREALDARCAYYAEDNPKFCRNTRTQNEIILELINEVPELKDVPDERKRILSDELRKTRIGALIEFSRAVHAEMDAIVSAARKGISVVGTRLFVTTFPCHYCARHIVAAGIDEVQYIEPYPKSKALDLHNDSIGVEKAADWKPPSENGKRVLFRPFSGVAPRMYKRAFNKDRELKNKNSGEMEYSRPEWGLPWHLGRISYVDLEAELTKRGKAECKKQDLRVLE